MLSGVAIELTYAFVTATQLMPSDQMNEGNMPLAVVMESATSLKVCSAFVIVHK